MGIHPLWQQYPTIKQDLQQTQKVMTRAVTTRNKEITAALQLFFESGGKLLRPAYFLLFTRFGSKPARKQRFHYAASLEILHAATLIHDDIIDESPLRRNLPSIQQTYGKDMAVYTGDFLFTIYFQLIAQASDDLSGLAFNADNMKRILIGELDQLSLKNNPNITVKQYLQHVQGKTAQLFQFSCYEGARFAKASKRTQILAQRIGYQIGMAFQILDDVLDYSATEEALQKPVLEDIRNGNYTLPLIYAMAENREAFALLAKGDELTDEDISLLVARIHEYGGLEKAQQLAERYTQRALREINKLPNIPEKAILHELTGQLLNRQN